ncbi:MAG TPA: CocE/NonD family hydrolase [Candidatus Thermoplasmatota archaeon]|nr:CocE/NonD family hydrolase [Candidatus Thermoplasmatota archaeon]
MRGPSLVVTLLLGLTVLAGCASHPAPADDPPATPAAKVYAPLTTATHQAGHYIDANVPSFDGTPLHIGIQLPDGDGPFPTILSDTPYNAGSTNHQGLEDQFGLPLGASTYVTYGYAVAVSHVRGTGESGGCLNIGGPEEGKDGYALVEWIAQQPWSNGKVAMSGTSYVGTTPLETAVWQPPHLTTIIPTSPVTEWYRYYFELGTHRRNGDPFPGSSDSDAALWLAEGVVPGVPNGAMSGVEDARCPIEFFLEQDGQDDYDAYWHARDHHAKAANIKAPMLFAHGWEDGNVAPSGFPTLWANVTAEKRLWMQQHGHGVPASKADYHEYVHRWLDYWMLGLDNGALLLPPVIIEDNLGRYRAEQDWPPADAAPLRLELGADGALTAAPGKAGTLSYSDDAVAPPVPGLPDQLRFAFGPVEEPIHLAGAPILHLKASSSMVGTQFDVNLLDVAPDGSFQLVDPAGNQAYVSRGFLDARHRDSLDHGSDLVPGTVYDLQFPLHFNDHVLQAGHTLLLVVKSTDDYVVRSPYRATNTLQVGAGSSWLELPIVTDAGRTFVDEPPAPWASP